MPLKKKTIVRSSDDALPPHNQEAEQAALSCVLLAGNSGSQAEVEALLTQLRPSYFYDERHRILHREMVAMRMAAHAVDLVTVISWLKAQKKPDGTLFDLVEQCGGRAYVSEVCDAASSVAGFQGYLPLLKEAALRRWCLQKTHRLGDLAKATELTPDHLREEFAEIFDQTANIGLSTQPMIQIVSPAQARAYEARPEDFLVGEGLITRAMMVTIGGEPGVGKSRLATTLAVAGARGNNRWMGYPVRSKWRTLILQSENDAMRLKEDFAAVPEQFNEHIRVTSGLSHGMAFDNLVFRRELRRFFDDWPFEMLVIDPWNDVSFEEGQKDYKQALLNISACFRGAQMPAVIIVAHLRKRGRDEAQRRKTGRELLHELSGSLALGSSSRTVFVVQAASPDMDDDRIVCEVAKANNCHPDWLKEHGVRTAWKRANGAFEQVEMDWNEYDNPGDPERRKITMEMLKACFNGDQELKPASIAKKMKEMFEVGQSTCFRAIDEDGYLRSQLIRTQTGGLRLK